MKYPSCASCIAVSKPMPLFAPVINTVFIVMLFTDVTLISKESYSLFNSSDVIVVIVGLFVDLLAINIGRNEKGQPIF